MRLTTSLLRWGKVLWLCCAGSTLAPESWCCAALHSVTNDLHVILDSYWFDKPWFLTEGNLLLCSSHVPLGVPNGRVNYTHQENFWRRCRGTEEKLHHKRSLTPTSTLRQQQISGAVAGEIKTRCKGSLHFSIYLLCFCLALFYLLLCLLHYIKIQKN